MIGVHKKFNNSLYKANDKPARATVKKLLEKQGYEVDDNPNKYGIDLICKKGDKTVYFECERRGFKSWKAGEFPFETVHIPCRKEKFLADDFAYATVSNDLSRVGILPPHAVRKYFKEEFAQEVSNVMVESGEFFFDIPKTSFRWYDVPKE